MRNFKRLSPFFIILVFLISGTTPTVDPQTASFGLQATPKEKPQEVELRGKIVCVAEEMHTHYAVELLKTRDPLYGVKTEDGGYYTLLPTSLAEALFVDEQLHEKDLILKGRVFPNTQLLEVIRFYSVKDGVIHELYYYCDICYIRAVAPGNCDCCQAPVVLIEKPLNVDSTIPSP